MSAKPPTQLTEQAILDFISTPEYSKIARKRFSEEKEFAKGLFIQGYFVEWETIDLILNRYFQRNITMPGEFTSFEVPEEASKDPSYFRKQRPNEEKSKLVKEIRFAAEPLIYSSNGVKRKLNVELSIVKTQQETLLSHLLKLVRSKQA